MADGHKLSVVYKLQASEPGTSRPVKNAIFLHLAPPLRVIPSEFRIDLSHYKTRVPVLSRGVVFEILCLSLLIQYWLVTHGRTNRRTRDDSKYRASIASQGKQVVALTGRNRTVPPCGVSE